MQKYNYTANNPSTNERVKSQVEAESEQGAAAAIKKQGLTPIEIVSTDKAGALSKFSNRVPGTDKILFSRQLSTLINAGLPLVQALRNTSTQGTGKAMNLVVTDLISDIEGGSTLAASLAKHPKVFNNVFINLVAAGEASGTLDKALERLADQQEKDADIVRKVRGAFTYPAIVLLVMLGVVGFMIVKVLPAVGSLISSIPGAKLPFVTNILLIVAHFIIKRWYVVLIIVAILVVLFIVGSKRKAGRSIIDRAKMVAWPAGPLFMKVYMARFCRTSATLIASGVPLIQVLEITGKAINNVHLMDSINKAIEKVKGGKSLSDSISGDPNFLPLVSNMIRIGEQSGTIEQMLARVADYYETEVDNQIKTLNTILEPVLMIILGVFAIIIVAAVLLPIYGLAANSNLTSSF